MLDSRRRDPASETSNPAISSEGGRYANTHDGSGMERRAYMRLRRTAPGSDGVVRQSLIGEVT